MINRLDADHTEVYSLESLKMVTPDFYELLFEKLDVNTNILFSKLMLLKYKNKCVCILMDSQNGFKCC